ncbi:MAG: hypothetical protein COV29_02195 [Candidatus Yanofskybacteria bacterium CG10_big_fil_rev_8_21_14_0_10_36_16]|uniref:ABC transporter ATP-binding protein n=1 Tax=Candidatus Yanofskybacteria bacterium CG10_big_fil_rev_8_21_14_0_10_36_16 TaxID=1975096 RepID=A0A2J0Q7K6_9BACT|nr:MAG: hypothetical protein COV29_02195 [Candidatus Yanofskybacteria bacterium CG10_big_fil_rev_8_21_14_0_10_36_16]
MFLINSKKIKRIIRLAFRGFRRYRKRLLLIFVLGVLSGLSGGFGVGAIIPLFSIVAGDLVEEGNAITELLKSVFEFLHIPFSLMSVVFFITVMFIIKGVINFLYKYINDKTAAEYEEEVRADLFNKVMHSRWPYLINQRLGYVERVLMNDVTISSRMFVHLSTLIIFTTSFFMYAIVAFNISAVITIVTMVFGLFLLFVFKPIFYKTRSKSKELADTEKLVTHHVSESILGSKIVKTSSAEDRVTNKSLGYFENLKKARVQVSIYVHSVGSIFEPVGFVFVAILFGFYLNSPSFSVISFGAVVYLIQKMFSFIQAAQGSIHRISEMSPYVQTVIDFRSLATSNKEEYSGSVNFEFKDKIELKDISFAYEDSTKVISNVNFEIKKGEMVGLVGVSGAGKTTIADLILRLFYPSSGEILVDGKNISEFNIKSWRRKIGYVPQDVFMMNDTIKNNIKFYDSTITNQDVEHAAKLSNIHDFIKKLPEGYDTNIGERGLKLSGGQRQRIALARTLARQPEILILDEATSSLDAKSEIAIQKAIENLKGRVTVLAIAHRLSTVKNSDKLIVLEKGKIVEQGTPDKLLSDKDSHFYKLYNIRN